MIKMKSISGRPKIIVFIVLGILCLLLLAGVFVCQYGFGNGFWAEISLSLFSSLFTGVLVAFAFELEHVRSLKKRKLRYDQRILELADLLFDKVESFTFCLVSLYDFKNLSEQMSSLDFILQAIGFCRGFLEKEDNWDSQEIHEIITETMSISGELRAAINQITSDLDLSNLFTEEERSIANELYLTVDKIICSKVHLERIAAIVETMSVICKCSFVRTALSDSYLQRTKSESAKMDITMSSRRLSRPERE